MQTTEAFRAMASRFEMLVSIVRLHARRARLLLASPYAFPLFETRLILELGVAHVRVYELW